MCQNTFWVPLYTFYTFVKRFVFNLLQKVFLENFDKLQYPILYLLSVNTKIEI